MQRNTFWFLKIWVLGIVLGYLLNSLMLNLFILALGHFNETKALKKEEKKYYFSFRQILKVLGAK